MNKRGIALTLLAVASMSCVVAAQADPPVAMRRLTPADIASLGSPNAERGARPGMTILVGDPAKPGLYTVRVSIPSHTRIPPHTHRDNRSVTVVSGTWHMGYGRTFDAAALTALPPGSVDTEPAGQPHFAETLDEPVVIYVTGYGPSNTVFVTAHSRSRSHPAVNGTK